MINFFTFKEICSIRCSQWLSWLLNRILFSEIFSELTNIFAVSQFGYDWCFVKLLFQLGPVDVLEELMTLQLFGISSIS